MTAQRRIAVLALCCLVSPVGAQNPGPYPADPGPQVTHAPTGLGLPLAWEASLVVSIGGIAPSPASVVFGPGGSVYFMTAAGLGCSPSATTDIYVTPVTGGVPGPISATQIFSTSQIEAQELVYDPVTDALYACGTCDQTTRVYRIPSSGVPEVLDPSTPLNDPDGLTIGEIPGSASPWLFVTTQDGLIAYDLLAQTPVATPITVDLAQVGAASLGNWGFPVWDANTGTLLAANVGRPATQRTVEITFTSTTSAVATLVGPDGVHPVLVDPQGVRFWRFDAHLGHISPGGPSATFLPLISTSAPGSLLLNDGLGGFLLVDRGSGDIIQLERTMQIDALTVSVSQGGLINLDIDASTAGRGLEGYMVFITSSGSSPGTTFQGAAVPLNPDFATQIGISFVLIGTPFTMNWAGFLPATGVASAVFNVIPGTIGSGLTLNLVTLCGNPGWSSNAVWVHTVP